MSAHILGIGSMGMLLAHEYAAASSLKPILLVKHKNIFNSIKGLQYSMTIARHNDLGVAYDTVNMQTRQSPRSERWNPEDKINNLVVATKTYSTKAALEPYIQFITPETNIMFVQNGMGVVPSVRDQIWQPNQEPRIYHILSSHGAYKERINLTRHVGHGLLNIARVPPRLNPEQAAYDEVPELVKVLLRSSRLNAKFTSSYPEFEVAQMEKLVVNACINPLTAMLDCNNGELLRSTQSISMINKVVNECVACFRKNKAIFEAVPEASTILSPDRLLDHVIQVCHTTAMNSSSMREDVRNNKMTEIDSINGYISNLGTKLGVSTPLNMTLFKMIKAKHELERFKEKELLTK